jgi:hypothetical protein
MLLVPSADNPLPFGTDPVYHVAISDTLVRAGGMPEDFLPYDPVAPTYTLGSHLVIAFASLQTPLDIHRLYQFLLPLCLVLSAGVLYQLGRLTFGVRAGFFAAFVYAFLGNWGSLDLLRWGSVPNALGMAFFLGAARFLVAPAGRLPVVVPGLFIGAMAATHHLSALIFALVCAVWALAALKGRPPDVAGGRVPKLPEAIVRMAGAWALGVLLVVPAVWILAAEVFRSVRSAEEAALDAGIPYLNVVEPLIPVWSVPGHIGIGVFVLAMVGLWRTRRDRANQPLRRDLLAWTATMAGAFALLDWPVRWAIDAIWGRELAILTPSRFLTDLAYPLAVFAGAGLVSLLRTARTMAIVFTAAGPAYAWWMLAPLMPEQAPRAEIDGLLWLSRNTPADSLVLQAPHWTTYVSGREGDWMVLREERLSEYTDRKRRLADLGSGAIGAWMREHNRPVYIWETRDLPARNLERVWQGDGVHIYRFLVLPD